MANLIPEGGKKERRDLDSKKNVAARRCRWAVHASLLKLAEQQLRRGLELAARQLEHGAAVGLGKPLPGSANPSPASCRTGRGLERSGLAVAAAGAAAMAAARAGRLVAW